MVSLELLKELLEVHNKKKEEYDKNASFYRDNALIALGKSLAIEEILNVAEQEKLMEKEKQEEA